MVTLPARVASAPIGTRARRDYNGAWSDRWTADHKAIVLRGPRSTLRGARLGATRSTGGSPAMEGSGSMATTTQENVAVARRLLEETFGAGKLELIDELCVDGYVDHDPIQGDHDRDSVKDSVAGYREAFPDLAFTVEDAFGADDRVVVRWKCRGHVRERVHGPAADRRRRASRSMGSPSTASRTARSPSPGRSGTRCGS